MRDELQRKGTVVNFNRPNKMVSISTRPNQKSKIIAESLDALHYDQPEPMMFVSKIEIK